jgi:hypothetical protein
MTDDDKALAGELRGIAAELSCNQYAAQVWVIGQAADRIEAQAAEIEELKSWKAAEDAHHHKLRAEIERLREALRDVLTGSTDIECGERVIYAGAVKSVRAALGETE